MSETKSQLLMRFRSVLVGRKKFSSNIHFFDIDIYDDKFECHYMWRTHQIRIIGLAQLSDMIKRFKRQELQGTDEEQSLEDSDFLVKWDDIEGIVTFDHHKQLMIRTRKEVIVINFQYPKHYEKFRDHVKTKVSDKIFSRDEVKMEESTYEGSTSLDKLPAKLR
jgi:hypothetical protein